MGRSRRVESMPLSACLPRRVILQVTDRCNALCRHCGYPTDGRGSGRLDLELARAFMDAVIWRWGIPEKMGLTGGEPMLYPGLTRSLIRMAHERGILVRLLTNASWVQEPAKARREVCRLLNAGLKGFWVSAGSFHAEGISFSCPRLLSEIASEHGIPCYVNFAYVHPKELGVRGRGIPEIHGDNEADRKTLGLHEVYASAHPGCTHGWARIWDIGRARALIDDLGPIASEQVRQDLARAVQSGKGDLHDLVGLGLNGKVFFREQNIGSTPAGHFDRLLARVFPKA